MEGVILSKDENNELSQESDVNEEVQEVENPLDEGENLEFNDSELEELKARVAELEDLKLREAAEFENLKKRYEKEKLTAIAYSNEGFARDILGVVDSLTSASELAVDEENLADSLSKIKEGLTLTIDQLNKVLGKNGVEVIDTESGFDPNFHDAIMQVDSEDHEKGMIVQAFQKGYKYKDRVLRPTMVSIAK